jgi:hypothetical protein
MSRRKHGFAYKVWEGSLTPISLAHFLGALRHRRRRRLPQCDFVGKRREHTSLALRAIVVQRLALAREGDRFQDA